MKEEVGKKNRDLLKIERGKITFRKPDLELQRVDDTIG